MLKCDRDEQWAEALSLWVDRKVVTYLSENHSRFEAILAEQGRMAAKYPVIMPFLDGEGAMELTAEEHQAVKDYLNLREQTELLNRKVRHQSKTLLQNADYKRICRTGRMVEFT